MHVCAGMAKKGSGKVGVGSVAVTAQTAVGRNPLLLARQAIMRGGPRLTAGALHSRVGSRLGLTSACRARSRIEALPISRRAVCVRK